MEKKTSFDTLRPNLHGHIKGQFEKGGDPIGTIKQFKDGKYVKLGENNWKKLPDKIQHLSQLSQDMVNVCKDTNLSIQGKVDALVKMGVTDIDKLVTLTGEKASVLVDKKLSGDKSSDGNKVAQALIKNTNDVVELPKPSVEARWKSYELMGRMVIKGQRKGLLAYGTGGVGKTYTINELLKESGLREYDEELDPEPSEYDYIKITGKSTAVAMYASLYEHNKKIVIFDDCDSVLTDENAIMILKGALDTSGDGTITWGSASPPKDSHGEKVPQRFKFRGRVIFISNIPKQTLLESKAQPVVTRSLSIDLTMTAEETVARLRYIRDKIPFQDHNGEEIFVTTEEREAAINFIDKYKHVVDVGNINARTMGSIALIKKEVFENPHLYDGLTWEEAALNIIQS